MKRYSAYKDSGIEWIGEIPEGWGVKRLKYLLKSVESGSRESQEQEFNDVDKIPSIGGEHISWSGNIEFTDNKFVSKKYFLRLKKGKIKTGDVLLVKDGATIGKTAFVKNEINAAINEHVFILRTNNNFKDGLLYYNLVSDFTQDLINLFSRGAAQAGLPSDFVSNIFLLIPPEPEQTAIATFLDHKTAKIDELIKKNEGLIELLKEKRQAIISHAVTKGLDPNAKMKDSGIEWLGEIPEGWEVKRLKYVANVNPEALIENINPAYELKYVDISNVGEEGLINKPEIMLFEDAPSRARRIIRQNDVIVSTVRTYLKAIAYFSNPDSNLIVSTGFAVLRVSDAVLPKLLYYFVRSDFFVESIMANSVGVSYPAINSSVVAGLPILVPPKNQQSEIIKFLDKETKKYDDLMKKILSQIDALKEYRQALISNVVTGKVRVNES